MSEERTRHLAEQRLDNVKPRAVSGSIDVLETIGPGGQKGPRLLGDVGRMIVQNQPDGEVGRIVTIQVLQQGDKLPAAMAPFHVSRRGKLAQKRPASELCRLHRESEGLFCEP